MQLKLTKNNIIFFRETKDFLVSFKTINMQCELKLFTIIAITKAKEQNPAEILTKDFNRKK